MTKQKGICEKCKEEYEYDYNPRYPRKYCHECSVKNKAEFETGGYKAETPEGVKINADELVPKQPFQKPKDNGFHLTPEQCRSNALASAIELNGVKAPDMSIKGYEALMELAKQFEKYLVTGE